MYYSGTGVTTHVSMQVTSVGEMVPRGPAHFVYDAIIR